MSEPVGLKRPRPSQKESDGFFVSTNTSVPNSGSTICFRLFFLSSHSSTGIDAEFTTNAILGVGAKPDLPLPNQVPDRLTALPARAYAAGVFGGRPSTVDWDRVVRLRNAGRSLREIAGEVSCSIGTVCRILRDARKGRQ